jgi:hypothetical protein
MKKNRAEFFQTVQVDPISGDYFIILPEEIINEFTWYEDTEIELHVEGNEIILREKELD